VVIAARNGTGCSREEVNPLFPKSSLSITFNIQATFICSTKAKRESRGSIVLRSPPLKGTTQFFIKKLDCPLFFEAMSVANSSSTAALIFVVQLLFKKEIGAI
jgi:hypothetical protein